MSEHRATISWRAEGDFKVGRYSRAHDWRFDGGAVVRASSSPNVVPLYSDAAAVDPEEALVASASACHMLWFLSLAQAAGLDVSNYRDDASGVLGRGDDGGMAMTRIVLRPRIMYVGEIPDEAAVRRLHDEAHARCFIAASLKTRIVVESAPGEDADG